MLPERTMMSLRTPRLLLRQWRPSDIAAFAVMNADARVMEFFRSTLTAEQSRAFADHMQRFLAENGYGMFAVEVPGVSDFIGYTGLAVPGFEAHFTPCVEIGWRLAFDHWGRGYASEAAAAVRDHAFDVLALPEIVSFTAEGNARSRRVMERIGMTHDPADDFDYPLHPVGHRLRRHVLYRLRRN
jgi:RimJ/RimL family protein N-acetyltransferase